jgi:hypothetical protein
MTKFIPQDTMAPEWSIAMIAKLVTTH